jgi:stearoyl-CoA desaturase (delta-9 desaturase)
VAGEEFSRLKLDAQEGRMMKRLLGEDFDTMPTLMRERLTQFCDRSEKFNQMIAMRAELEALWARSTASHEQLVKQLQDWIARAEASGIRQLEEFSTSLRRYAV